MLNSIEYLGGNDRQMLARQKRYSIFNLTDVYPVLEQLSDPARRPPSSHVLVVSPLGRIGVVSQLAWFDSL